MMVYKIIKQVCEEIADPLVLLINKSIATGKFPSILKTTVVVPLPKKGDTLDIENYRPISLLSTLSKILERVLCCAVDGFSVFINV